MISKLRGRVSSAHVIALAALFVALGGTAYAAATVGTSDIKDGAVTTNKIRNKAVTRQKIADAAVVTRTIKDNAVKTAKIADAAVTNTKIGPDAIDSSKVLDGSIGTTDLTDAAVTTGKLGDAAVDSTKLADASVGSSKLASNAVTAGKLAITPRTTTVDVANNTTALLESPCLAGEKVVGGGAPGRPDSATPRPREPTSSIRARTLTSAVGRHAGTTGAARSAPCSCGRSALEPDVHEINVQVA
jgi:hypothetical protein